MTQMVFPPPPVVSLAILNSAARLPVRRIYCVGQNYAAHAKEMGAPAKRDAPFFFMKHPQDVVASGATIAYPAGTENLHFELELVAVLGKPLFQASAEAAREAIYGYAVGLDLTRRDLQQKLRSQSLPWALSKSFANAAVLSAVNTAVDENTLAEQTLTLKQNGDIKQHASLGEMMRDTATLLAYLSQMGALHPGDLLFTGTPAGVGAIAKGDTLHGEITGVGTLDLCFAND